MKDFDASLLPDTGCAVLTVPEIGADGPMYLADFRDVHVLTYRPTGHFIGFSPERGLTLCKGPLRMVNGIWTATEDEAARKSHHDVRLGAELLDLRPV